MLFLPINHITSIGFSLCDKYKIPVIFHSYSPVLFNLMGFHVFYIVADLLLPSDAAPEVVEKPGDNSLSKLKNLYAVAKELSETEVKCVLVSFMKLTSYSQ